MHDGSSVAIVGRGRLGRALADTLREAGVSVQGPLGRGADGAGADVVLLCVPDGEIAPAAARVVPGRLVGHCSGATTLEPLAGHEAFSLHPLMTVPEHGATFAGATAAVAGSTPRALEAARTLAERLGLRPVEVVDADRAAYHAAASIASNFLVTLEGAAEDLGATAGVDRAVLVPLVRAAVENWAAAGAEHALTGPIARGDEDTVARQRDAVAERTPELLPLWDALAEATRALAQKPGAQRPTPDPSMRTVRTVAELREALAPHRRAGRTIGLVPTMGAFHAGHLTLMRRARADTDVVVVSLFVNPTQFRPGEDLSAYPRDEAADAAEAAALGVDLLFAPAPEEVYPAGFATDVRVATVTEPLEGAARGPEHFHGVTTVVTKLFNMVGPDVAYFGQKDAQQVAVIRQLVRDLDIAVRVEVCPTVREDDGLALSSRNRYLEGADRERAVALSQALRAAEDAVHGGERDAATIVARARAALAEHDVEPEYLELVSADTLAPVERVGDADVLVAVAARVGPARLIDNTVLLAAPPLSRGKSPGRP